MSDPHRIAKLVLIDVAQNGAVTTRSMIARYGPKPNWRILLEDGYVTELQTIYGAVLTLGPLGRTGLAETPPPFPVPYVAAPGTAADRAYLMDAIAVLERDHYSVVRHFYKKAGKVGTAARKGRDTTDQITSTVMRVPPDRLRYLEWKYHRFIDTSPRSGGYIPERPGYPRLYATISGGGIRLPRLRKLMALHRDDQRIRWRSPLIVAVPEEGDMRAYLRQLEARETALIERASLRPVDEPVTLVHLIVLPLP